VDPGPHPLLLRKSGSAGNRTRELWVCSQEIWPLDHRSILIRQCLMVYVRSYMASISEDAPLQKSLLGQFQGQLGPTQQSLCGLWHCRYWRCRKIAVSQNANTSILTSMSINFFALMRKAFNCSYIIKFALNWNSALSMIYFSSLFLVTVLPGNILPMPSNYQRLDLRSNNHCFIRVISCPFK
jgi:hypothetical protein